MTRTQIESLHYSASCYAVQCWRCGFVEQFTCTQDASDADLQSVARGLHAVAASIRACGDDGLRVVFMGRLNREL